MKNVAVLVMFLRSGGAERAAGLLSKYLSQQYNVYLFLMDSKDISYDYGGQIINISSYGSNLAENVRMLKQSHQIDAAISFGDEMNVLNIRSRATETVIISNRVSYGEMNPFPPGTSVRAKLWYDKSDKIISCSYGAKYDLVHFFGLPEDLIRPIYNFIDKQRIKERSCDELPKKITDFKGNSKLILCVGRLEEQKNHRKLLQQFSLLLSSGYDAKLIILGSGALEHELKQLAIDLHIDTRVLFETFCSNPFPYYSAADIMACSTDFEGLPNVILEAFTLGLPVVSVDCLSGPRELIKGSSDYSNRTKGVELCDRGVLVEKTDTDTFGTTEYLANGMKILLNSKEICRNISYNTIGYMEKYTNESLLSEWESVIETTFPTKTTRLPLPEPFSGLNPQKKVIIYGAGKVAKMILQYFICAGREHEVFCFAVSDAANNPSDIMGYPVHEINELLQYKEVSVVIIGVSSQYEYEISCNLEKYGFIYVYSDL